MVQLSLCVLYTGHVTACDTRRRELYCFACSDYIYDADFDSAMLVLNSLLYSRGCLQSCFKTPFPEVVADQRGTLVPFVMPALMSRDTLRSSIKCLLQGVSAVKLNVPDVPKKVKDESPEAKSTTRQLSGMLTASDARRHGCHAHPWLGNA